MVSRPRRAPVAVRYFKQLDTVRSCDREYILIGHYPGQLTKIRGSHQENLNPSLRQNDLKLFLTRQQQLCWLCAQLGSGLLRTLGLKAGSRLQKFQRWFLIEDSPQAPQAKVDAL
jgi:hypothetical protein